MRAFRDWIDSSRPGSAEGQALPPRLFGPQQPQVPVTHSTHHRGAEDSDEDIPGKLPPRTRRSIGSFDGQEARLAPSRKISLHRQVPSLPSKPKAKLRASLPGYGKNYKSPQTPQPQGPTYHSSRSPANGKAKSQASRTSEVGSAAAGLPSFSRRATLGDTTLKKLQPTPTSAATNNKAPSAQKTPAATPAASSQSRQNLSAFEATRKDRASNSPHSKIVGGVGPSPLQSTPSPFCAPTDRPLTISTTGSTALNRPDAVQETSKSALARVVQDLIAQRQAYFQDNIQVTRRAISEGSEAELVDQNDGGGPPSVSSSQSSGSGSIEASSRTINHITARDLVMDEASASNEDSNSEAEDEDDDDDGNISDLIDDGGDEDGQESEEEDIEPVKPAPTRRRQRSKKVLLISDESSDDEPTPDASHGDAWEGLSVASAADASRRHPSASPALVAEDRDAITPPNEPLDADDNDEDSSSGSEGGMFVKQRRRQPTQSMPIKVEPQSELGYEGTDEPDGSEVNGGTLDVDTESPADRGSAHLVDDEQQFAPLVETDDAHPEPITASIDLAPAVLSSRPEDKDMEEATSPAAQDETAYVIDRLAGHHVENGQVFFDVLWDGFKESTVEPELSLHEQAPLLLFTYWRRWKGGRPGALGEGNCMTPYKIIDSRITYITDRQKAGVGKRVRGGRLRKRLEYQIEWLGRPKRQASWSLALDLFGTYDVLIRQYMERQESEYDNDDDEPDGGHDVSRDDDTSLVQAASPAKHIMTKAPERKRGVMLHKPDVQGSTNSTVDTNLSTAGTVTKGTEARPPLRDNRRRSSRTVHSANQSLMEEDAGQGQAIAAADHSADETMAQKTTAASINGQSLVGSNMADDNVEISGTQQPYKDPSQETEPVRMPASPDQLTRASPQATETSLTTTGGGNDNAALAEKESSRRSRQSLKAAEEPLAPRPPNTPRASTQMVVAIEIPSPASISNLNFTPPRTDRPPINRSSRKRKAPRRPIDEDDDDNDNNNNNNNNEAADKNDDDDDFVPAPVTPEPAPAPPPSARRDPARSTRKMRKLGPRLPHAGALFADGGGGLDGIDGVDGLDDDLILRTPLATSKRQSTPFPMFTAGSGTFSASKSSKKKQSRRR